MFENQHFTNFIFIKCSYTAFEISYYTLSTSIPSVSYILGCHVSIEDHDSLINFILSFPNLNGESSIYRKINIVKF